MPEHKHTLKLVRLPGITMRFKCITCHHRVVYLRSSIRGMLRNGTPYKPTYQMGAW